MKNLFEMMKTSAYLICFIVSVCLYACSNENQDIPSDTLKSGQIEIKVNPGKNNDVSFTAIADKITIDWGDGHVEQFTGYSTPLSHSYANQDLKTITIQTEKLVWFATILELMSIDGQLTWGYFREMRFGEMNTLARLTIGCPTLSVLEIEKASALIQFNLSGQLLTSFDVSGLTALEEFHCSDNSFTSLDLRSLHTLKTFACVNNPLTSLDLRGLTSLITLSCASNQLTTLNLTGCTSLGSIDCSRNQLTSLDISGLTSLSNLLCFNNQLSSNTLNTIFENLPERTGTSMLIIENNPGFDTCNREIAINKGWYFGRLG